MKIDVAFSSPFRIASNTSQFSVEIKEEPENETALIMLGGAYFSMQKYSEAEMVFERLILMEPGRGEFSIALFNTLWKMGREEEALEEIKRFMLHADKIAEKSTIEQYMEIIDSYLLFRDQCYP